MTKIYDRISRFTYRHTKPHVVKGIRNHHGARGEARKWGSSVRITEQEANKRQIEILKGYIKELKARKQVELSRGDFKRFMDSLTPN